MYFHWYLFEKSFARMLNGKRRLFSEGKCNNRKMCTAILRLTICEVYSFTLLCDIPRRILRFGWPSIGSANRREVHSFFLNLSYGTFLCNVQESILTREAVFSPLIEVEINKYHILLRNFLSCAVCFFLQMSYFVLLSNFLA